MAAAEFEGILLFNQTLDLPFETEETTDNFEQSAANLCKSLLEQEDVLRADVTQVLGADEYLFTVVLNNGENNLEAKKTQITNTLSNSKFSELSITEGGKYEVIDPKDELGLACRLVADEPEVLFLKNFVHVWVTAGNEEEFIDATLKNVEGSLEEPGIARFDFLRDLTNPSHFALVEVFKSAEAPGEHKKTEHYLTWRQTVADWMAQNRSAVKTQCSVFPQRESAWDSHLEALDLKPVETERQESITEEN